MRTLSSLLLAAAAPPSLLVAGLAAPARTPASAQRPPGGGPGVDRVVDLCYASSLAYLPIGDIPSSEYAARVPNLRPIAQVVEPSTESGATVFLWGGRGGNGDGDGGGEAEDTVVVACRGSATPKNFATNLRFGLKPLAESVLSAGGTSGGDGVRDGRGEVLAHEGFQEAAEGLWKMLEPTLLGDVMGGRKSRIVFTGHSLGGGTAELIALHAQASLSSGTKMEGSNVVVDEVTTFGGPIIGNGAFAAFVDETALRDATVRHIVHGADPILANNGPLWGRLGFRRSGSEVRCDPDEARVYAGGEGYDVAVRRVPWAIIDHCKYLGIFVGPRLW